MFALFRAALGAVAFVSFLGAGSLLAHEGHDHDAPPPATISNLAPRAEAVSELYELVAIARAGGLAVYLDRFATNESVDGASVHGRSTTRLSGIRIAAPDSNEPAAGAIGSRSLKPRPKIAAPA